MQDQQVEGFGDLWKQVVPLILKSPQVLTSVCMTWVMGYGMSFLLFEYRTNPRKVSTWLHLSLGGAYAAFVFLVINWHLVFREVFNFDHLTQKAPQTIVVSGAILFILFIVITLCRERQKA